MLPVLHFPSGAPVDLSRLSIVLQGGLSAGNLVETATYCRHWRSLFPDAEIILSLSGTDVVRGECLGGLIANPQLASGLRSNSQMNAAMSAIRETCDKLALRSDGLPLPPIKADTPKSNNINLQIAAAQNGLSHATGEHVLRVRSDFVFLDKGFIDQYETMSALRRGPRSVFSDRVMISWLYTLNPYTYERLPLHFSDWFNFGRLSDVRALWDVPFVELADAVHYQAHPHPAGSNAAERLFNIRVADEQHLMLHAMRKHVPDLQLDTLVDDRAVDVGMDILADNFCLCDLTKSKAYFPKYKSDFSNPDKLSHCLTPEDWLLMVRCRGIDYRVTLAHKILAARDPRLFESREAFPRTYQASRLFSKVGYHVNGEIVATGTTGTLVFGPHVSIPAGRYRASVNATTTEGPGVIVLRASLEHGALRLAERRLALRSGERVDLTLDFEVTEAKGNDFEIVVDIEGVRAMAVSAITISERDGDATVPSLPYYSATAISAEQLLHGPPSRGASDGRWCKVGEIPSLSPGNYLASLNILSIGGAGRIHVRLTADRGETLFAHQTVDVDAAGERIGFSVPLTLSGSKALDVEVECYADGLSSIEIAGVLFTQREADFGSELAEYYYSAASLPTRIGRLEDGRIVSSGASGVLSYGPYISLPPGNYSARPILSRLDGRGTFTMTATAEVGTKRLAKIEHKCGPAGLTLPGLHFSVDDSYANEVELACSIKGLKNVALDGILIIKR